MWLVLFKRFRKFLGACKAVRLLIVWLVIVGLVIGFSLLTILIENPERLISEGAPRSTGNYSGVVPPSSVPSDYFDKWAAMAAQLDWSKIPDDVSLELPPDRLYPGNKKMAAYTYLLFSDICMEETVNYSGAAGTITPAMLFGIMENESGINWIDTAHTMESGDGEELALTPYTAVVNPNGAFAQGPFGFAYATQELNKREGAAGNRYYVYISKYENPNLEDGKRAIRGTYWELCGNSPGARATYVSNGVTVETNAVNSDMRFFDAGGELRPNILFLPDAAYSTARNLRVTLEGKDVYTLYGSAIAQENIENIATYVGIDQDNVSRLLVMSALVWRSGHFGYSAYPSMNNGKLLGTNIVTNLFVSMAGDNRLGLDFYSRRAIISYDGKTIAVPSYSTDKTKINVIATGAAHMSLGIEQFNTDAKVIQSIRSGAIPNILDYFDAAGAPYATSLYNYRAGGSKIEVDGLAQAASWKLSYASAKEAVRQVNANAYPDTLYPLVSINMGEYQAESVQWIIEELYANEGYRYVDAESPLDVAEGEPEMDDTVPVFGVGRATIDPEFQYGRTRFQDWGNVWSGNVIEVSPDNRGGTRWQWLDGDLGGGGTRPAWDWPFMEESGGAAEDDPGTAEPPGGSDDPVDPPPPPPVDTPGGQGGAAGNAADESPEEQEAWMNAVTLTDARKAPVVYSRLSDTYGCSSTIHGIWGHLGNDYGGCNGNAITATANGYVVKRKVSNVGFGRYVMVQYHDSGGRNIYLLYAHMSSIASGLKVGDKVAPGMLLGYVGKSGNAYGPHLHLEASLGTAVGTGGCVNHVNPWRYVNPSDTQSVFNHCTGCTCNSSECVAKRKK